MASIPIIDISDRDSQAPHELLTAASTHGFVFVENDAGDLITSKINNIFKIARQFFDSPIEIKMPSSISSNQAGSNHGWLRQGVEKLDPATQQNADVKEAVNIPVPLSDNSFFPDILEAHRQEVLEFQHACQRLCDQILSQLAVALAIPVDWFSTRHDHRNGTSGTTLRLLYYPASAGPDRDVADIRAGAHSDFGSLTLLFQLPGQPGLEIKNADGSWSAVSVDPSNNLSKGKPLPILVNIGDLLEDWTGGLLKSTVHRVVFPAESKDAGDRYSVAYFCHPLDDVVLEPVPSKLVQQRQGLAQGARIGMTAKQHLMNRLAATYTIKA